jgi:hypothetical protein
MGRITEKIKNWYRGKYVAPPDNDPESGLVFVSPGHYEPSLSAKIVKALIQFWLNHWKFILGFSVSVAGLYIAFLRLK